MRHRVSKNKYGIELEITPEIVYTTVSLDEFSDASILEYVEEELKYTVVQGESDDNTVLDEITNNLKQEFVNGLTYQQIDTMVKHKELILKLIDNPDSFYKRVNTYNPNHKSI